MYRYSQHWLLLLIAAGLAVGGSAGAQQTVPEAGRRLAPPFPTHQPILVRPQPAPTPLAIPVPSVVSTTPPLPERRFAPPMPPLVTAPPAQAPARALAPPMPPVVTLPLPPITLPTPCFFGRFACPDTHRYAVFGDSIAAGAVALRGYPALYTQLLEDSLGIRIDRANFARSGLTTAELAQSLALGTAERRALAQAHVVTWNVGGNDFRAARFRYKQGLCGGADNQDCLREALVSFQRSWNDIVQIMSATRAQRPTLTRSMDLYNPHVREDRGTDTWHDDGGLYDYEVLQPYLNSANAHIAYTLTVAGIPFVRVSDMFNNPDNTVDPFDRGYLSRDGFHPNDTGHKIIAHALWRLGIADFP